MQSMRGRLLRHLFDMIEKEVTATYTTTDFRVKPQGSLSAPIIPATLHTPLDNK